MELESQVILALIINATSAIGHAFVTAIAVF